MNIEKDYTTVRFGPLKAVLAGGGWGWHCYTVLPSLQVFKEVCQAVETKLAYTTVRSGLVTIAPVWCANL